jgi:hypothetical protein
MRTSGVSPTRLSPSVKTLEIDGPRSLAQDLEGAAPHEGPAHFSRLAAELEVLHRVVALRDNAALNRGRIRLQDDLDVAHLGRDLQRLRGLEALQADPDATVLVPRRLRQLKASVAVCPSLPHAARETTP